MEAKIDKIRRLAEAAGTRDGLAWDLDGFSSWEEVCLSREGWDEATINAGCADDWLPDAPTDDDERLAACEAYNTACHAAVLSDSHHGLGPKGSEDDDE